MIDNRKTAVIFDVDGPLLELTPAEEDLFFAPLETQYGLTDLSRDWDSYPIRNDIEIYREILHKYFGRPPSSSELAATSSRYVAALAAGYETQTLGVAAIPGARRLLERLAAVPHLTLGIATANLGAAARLRLEHAGLWSFIREHPGAAEYGGAKSNILATVLDGIDVPSNRVVFLGDNLNDLEAARATGTHFIGFHPDEHRRKRLADAGATRVCGDHDASWQLIQDSLGSD